MAKAKLVVVTGCDTGFGRIACTRLAGQGWHVIAGCFTEAGCEELRKESPNIHPAQLDVTSDKSVDEFAKVVQGWCNGIENWGTAGHAAERSHGLDGLINNAGLAPTGYVEWAPLADLQRAMDINVYGQIRMAKALLPLLRKAQGRIINVSSICGRLAFGGAAWYSCTKFAVEGWTDSLRREMQPFGVSVHLVEPGFFQTNMVNIPQYENVLKKQWAALDDEQKTAYGEQTLTGYVQNIKDQVNMLADPNAGKVVDSMIIALTARFAKSRYPVGGSARWLFLPISHMPTWIGDGILAIMNPKYKPDGKVSQPVPRRLDLVALWLILVPLLSKVLGGMGYSKKMKWLISAAFAWCLSWKMS